MNLLLFFRLFYWSFSELAELIYTFESPSVTCHCYIWGFSMNLLNTLINNRNYLLHIELTG